MCRCLSQTQWFITLCGSYVWLNCTCSLHVKWEMSSLYDMYIVHVLPVKEKKNFYKEDNFSTWESFLYVRLETGRIMWLGMAGVQTGFRTITLVLYIGSLPNLATWFPCGRGRTLFILGSLGQSSRSPLLWIEFLTTGSFPHDNFNSVYWIFNKFGHLIPL